jgi:hypothetical protein
VAPAMDQFKYGQLENTKTIPGNQYFLVEPGDYASKKQILEAGGPIKKEELKNSHIIVYWLWKEREDKETKEKKTFAKP